jgi:hypothetical protein
MKKWGVRLIACLFFIRAISGAYNLIAYIGPAGSFSGWVMEFNGWNINTDFMGWVELVIPVYIGFQLLRFNPSGRFWALTILWLATLSLGGFLIWLSVLVAQAFYYNKPMNFSHTNWFGEIRGPIPFLLFLASIFVFYAIPTYYLMRKDVKQLFEKPVAAEGTTDIIQGEKS